MAAAGHAERPRRRRGRPLLVEAGSAGHGGRAGGGEGCCRRPVSSGSTRGRGRPRGSAAHAAAGADGVAQEARGLDDKAGRVHLRGCPAVGEGVERGGSGLQDPVTASFSLLAAASDRPTRAYAGLAERGKAALSTRRSRCSAGGESPPRSLSCLCAGCGRCLRALNLRTPVSRRSRPPSHVRPASPLRPGCRYSRHANGEPETRRRCV